MIKISWQNMLHDKTISSEQDSKAATRGVLYKKLFLKISQNSLQNTCVGVFY